MATDPPPDLTLAPLVGTPRTVREWLTTFHLVFVALDPYTNESAWILPTATRVLTHFEQADCRVALLMATHEEGCRLFLGPWSRELLTFVDPDRVAISAFGLERLPALVHLGMDGTVVNSAEGWVPREWKVVTDHLAKVTSWSAPNLPTAADPGPFPGTPALG